MASTSGLLQDKVKKVKSKRGRGRVLFKKYTSPALLLFYLRYANRGIPFFVGSSTNPCVSGLT